MSSCCRLFCRPYLCPWNWCCVISEEANVFITEVFGANDSFQHEPCLNLSCHSQIVYIQVPLWVFWRYQPNPKCFWPFQAPNCWSQCIFYWYSTTSNNLSRCIYPAQKFEVYHDQILCRCCFKCSLLHQSSPVLEWLLCSWEMFLLIYWRFHLQDFVNWRHQNFPVGTGIAACRIFLIKFLISLNVTSFVIHTIFCSSVSITPCLSHASSMHHVAPSTIQPLTSFQTSHWPSPDSNLFLDIVS